MRAASRRRQRADAFTPLEALDEIDDTELEVARDERERQLDDALSDEPTLVVVATSDFRALDQRGRLERVSAGQDLSRLPRWQILDLLDRELATVEPVSLLGKALHEPETVPGPSGPPIPTSKRRVSVTRRCGSPPCVNPIPPSRASSGADYCSPTCRRRERKRRARARARDSR